MTVEKYKKDVPAWLEENPLDDMELAAASDKKLQDEITHNEIVSLRQSTNRSLEINRLFQESFERNIADQPEPLNADKTLIAELRRISTPKSSREIFSDAISILEDSQKQELNRRFCEYLGTSKLTIDMLPETAEILERTFLLYHKEFREKGYIDFNSIDKQSGRFQSDLYRVFDKDVYSFYERVCLTDSEIEELESIIPDFAERQKMFVKFMRGAPVCLKNQPRKNSTRVKKMFLKILASVSRVLGFQNALEKTFQEIKSNSIRVRNEPIATSSISREEIEEYKEAHRKHKEWVKSLDRNTLETVVAIQRMRKTAKIQSRFSVSRLEGLLRKFPEALKKLHKKIKTFIPEKESQKNEQKHIISIN